MKYIYDLHNTMLEHHLILVYEGEFTQEITKSVLSMAERNMDSIGEESSVKRKVFNVMVETLQNIVKHGEDNENTHIRTNLAIFLIGKKENEYVVSSGNAIGKETVAMLTERLEHINSLDKDGLKNLYKDIIKGNAGLSEKGGAGLGFVDMARKSGNKLEYHFEDIDAKTSFFSVTTRVPRA